MSLRVLLLNGPPRCGKDTISSALHRFDPIIHEEKFARPLKDTAPLLYGVTRDEWIRKYDTSAYKDMPSPTFFGKSAREVQIAISENLLKPLHGKDVFGRLLVSRINKLPRAEAPPRLVVVSDSGFRAEAEKVVEEVGKDNVFLCRIYRKGCDYSGDSRGYISLADIGVREVELQNTGTEDDLARSAERLATILRLPREYIKVEGEALLHGDHTRRLETDTEYQDRVTANLQHWSMTYADTAVHADSEAYKNSNSGGGSR